MEKMLWCESKGISFPIPTRRSWDTCHLISYEFPIPTIFLPYEPKEAEFSGYNKAQVEF